MSRKRFLTQTEIDSILDRFPIPDSSRLTQRSVYNKTINLLQNQLKQVQIYPSQIDEFADLIIKGHMNTLVAPGENVGILTAQSIGEKQTQLSLERNEKVIVRIRNTHIKEVPIGEFVDSLMEDYGVLVQKIPDHENSTSLNTTKMNIQVLTVYPNQNVWFENISEVTRHPANGDLARFYTKSGRSVCVTLSHSLLKLDKESNQIVPVIAKDVCVGDTIPSLFGLDHAIDRYSRIFCSISWFYGYYLRYGVQTKYGTHFRKVSPSIKKFLRQHQFEVTSDGTVLGARLSRFFGLDEQFVNNRLWNRVRNPISFFQSFLENQSFQNINCRFGSQNLINVIAYLFNRLRIQTRMDTVQQTLSLSISDAYTISKTCRVKFDRWSMFKINMLNLFHRRSSLTTGVFWDPIVRIEPVQTNEFVYDFTVPNSETFMLSNGIFVHNTLNSFHQCGISIKTLVTGVPRFMELMNTTREPKGQSCRIYMSKNPSTIKELRDLIGWSLCQVTMNMLISDWEIQHPVNYKQKWWHVLVAEEHQQILKQHSFLRLHLNKNILAKNRLSMTYICNYLNELFTDIMAITSSIRESIVDIIVVNIDGLQNSFSEETKTYITNQNMLDVFFEDVVLKQFEKTTVSGIEGVNDFVVQYQNNQWIIDTEGSNYKKILALPWVNTTKCISNNMWEILDVLGIEATREFLIREFSNVISSDGSEINERHVSLLVDTMTYRGDITSVSRYGLRNKASPMARSSFEESVENFIKSGIFCETDNVQSISSNIMCGKLSHTGTGLNDLLYDVSEREEVTQDTSVSSCYNIRPVTNLNKNNTFVQTLATIFE